MGLRIVWTFPAARCAIWRTCHRRRHSAPAPGIVGVERDRRQRRVRSPSGMSGTASRKIGDCRRRGCRERSRATRLPRKHYRLVRRAPTHYDSLRHRPPALFRRVLHAKPLHVSRRLFIRLQMVLMRMVPVECGSLFVPGVADFGTRPGRKK